MIARALKLDPVAFRRQNLLRDGRPHASGTILRDAPLEEVLDRLCERLNWSAPFDRGKGYASTRPRSRHRTQGGDFADDIRVDDQRQR